MFPSKSCNFSLIIVWCSTHTFHIEGSFIPLNCRFSATFSAFPQTDKTEQSPKHYNNICLRCWWGPTHINLSFAAYLSTRLQTISRLRQLKTFIKNDAFEIQFISACIYFYLIFFMSCKLTMFQVSNRNIRLYKSIIFY